jgi:WhiB family redox-sensing transcriptional regulator
MMASVGYSNRRSPLACATRGLRSADRPPLPATMMTCGHSPRPRHVPCHPRSSPASPRALWAPPLFSRGADWGGARRDGLGLEQTPSSAPSGIEMRLPQPQYFPGPNADHWDWQMRARCRGTDTSVFLPPDGERGRARWEREERAKQMCRDCPVIAQCRLHALTLLEPFGVWGGLSEIEHALLHETETAAAPRVRCASRIAVVPVAPSNHPS